MEALTRLGLDGPPLLADSVLAYAVARRPAVARFHELRAVAALRAGFCDVAVDELIELVSFGTERPDGPALVRACQAEQRSPKREGGSAGEGSR